MPQWQMKSTLCQYVNDLNAYKNESANWLKSALEL